jgi:hypothetical protein
MVIASGMPDFRDPLGGPKHILSHHDQSVATIHRDRRQIPLFNPL